MSDPAANPAPEPPAPKPTVAEAKANLLAQGEATQREIAALIERARVDVNGLAAGLKRAAPWAAVGALGVGLLLGRGGRRRAAGNMAERLRGLAVTLGPLAWDLFLKNRGKRGER